MLLIKLEKQDRKYCLSDGPENFQRVTVSNDKV